MAHFTNPVNKLEVCPFDPTHRVKSSRLQLHITKCRLNHLDDEKEICPFNAQHRFDRGTLQNHILSCPDRAPIDRSLIATRNTNDFYKGHTGVPPYNSVDVPAGESWDEEIRSCPTAGYIPKQIPPNRGIRTDFGNMQPAERKKYYKQLFSSDTSDDMGPLSRSESPLSFLPELKSPKSMSEAEIVVKEKMTKLQNIGLGRGQPPTPQSRIAANIFGGSPFTPMRQPQTNCFAKAVQTGIGVGRGTGTNMSLSQIQHGHDMGGLSDE